MATTGARGLASLASNAQCELLAAMVLEGASEAVMYQALTGQPLPGEYGERTSARLRGIRFERRLYEGDAAMLRLCVAQWANADPMALTVRDLRVEVPSDNGTGRARRLAITRSILRDFREGKPVPDIIIQPQMLVSVGAGRRTWFISADYLALGGSRNGYIPGEIKSHILTSNRGNSVEVRRTRLQAAVEILALRSECRRLGFEVDERDNRALLSSGAPMVLNPPTQ